MNYAKGELMGQLTADPTHKQINEESSVTNFDLAVNIGQNDKRKVNFYNCAAWNGLGQVAMSLKKGQTIKLLGRQEIQEWADKDTGSKRSKVVVTANEITTLLPRRQSQTAEAETTQASHEDVVEHVDAEEDIPLA